MSVDERSELTVGGLTSSRQRRQIARFFFNIRPFPFTTVGRMGHMGRSGTSGSFFGTPDLLMPSEQ